MRINVEEIDERVDPIFRKFVEMLIEVNSHYPGIVVARRYCHENTCKARAISCTK